MLMQKEEAPGTIVLTDISNGQEEIVSLKRLEINESECQLGIILPVDGIFDQEYRI